MRHDRRVVASHWLTTSIQDLAVSKRLTDEMPNVACFHAQQAAEKAIKAVLVARCGDAARDHSIVTLLTECQSAGMRIDPALVDDARRLDKFYVSSRYPDALGGLDPTSMFGASEATEAAARASRFLDFAKQAIDEELGRTCD